MNLFHSYYPDMFTVARHEDCCPRCGTPYPVACIADAPAQCEDCDPEDMEEDDDASLQ